MCFLSFFFIVLERILCRDGRKGFVRVCRNVKSLTGGFRFSGQSRKECIFIRAKGSGERKRLEKDNEGYASTAISFYFQRERESQKFQFQPDAARTENLFFFRWFCGLLS